MSEIAGLTVGPGELKFGRLLAGQWRGGEPAWIPVMVMRGAQMGPRLWIDTAIHGNEVVGIEVIRRLMREEVDPQRLRGTIVAVPVVNPFAFHVGRRGNPLLYDTLDTADVHAAFPGDPQGTLNDRLAHRVFSECVKCDYVVNIHTNTYPAVPFSGVATCENQAVLDASVAMAEAFGLPVTEMRVGAGAPIMPAGWPILATLRAGKPTFIIELQHTGYMQESSVHLGVLGFKNVLRHLRMLDGEIVPLPGLKVPPGRYGRRFVMSNAGGLAHFCVDAGDWVDRGALMLTIRDVYGDVVEEVRAPEQGYIRSVLFGPHNAAVYEGAIVAAILIVDPGRRYFHD